MQDYYGAQAQAQRSLPAEIEEQQSFKFMEAPVSILKFWTDIESGSFEQN